MDTFQIVIGKKRPQAVDWAARRTEQNRSGLIRDALRARLRRLESHSIEERDRDGYAAKAHIEGSTAKWETEAVWPEE